MQLRHRSKIHCNLQTSLITIAAIALVLLDSPCAASHHKSHHKHHHKRESSTLSPSTLSHCSDAVCLKANRSPCIPSQVKCGDCLPGYESNGAFCQPITLRKRSPENNNQSEAATTTASSWIGLEPADLADKPYLMAVVIVSCVTCLVFSILLIVYCCHVMRSKKDAQPAPYSPVKKVSPMFDINKEAGDVVSLGLYGERKAQITSSQRSVESTEDSSGSENDEDGADYIGEFCPPTSTAAGGAGLTRLHNPLFDPNRGRRSGESAKSITSSSVSGDSTTTTLAKLQ